MGAACARAEAAPARPHAAPLSVTHSSTHRTATIPASARSAAGLTQATPLRRQAALCDCQELLHVVAAAAAAVVVVVVLKQSFFSLLLVASAHPSVPTLI